MLHGGLARVPRLGTSPRYANSNVKSPGVVMDYPPDDLTIW